MSCQVLFAAKLIDMYEYFILQKRQNCFFLQVVSREQMKLFKKTFPVQEKFFDRTHTHN